MSYLRLGHKHAFELAEGASPTQAPGTTSSVLPETTIRDDGCALTDGMKSGRSIQTGWVTSDPATDNVDDIRPDKEGTWSVASENNPALLITLVEDQQDAIPVGRVELTSNVDRINVLYKTSNTDDAYKPVTKNAKTNIPKVG